MQFKIGDRVVGDGSPAFIIAELSCNHNQDFNIAVKTIKAIKKAGADAIKIQTYTPDTITLNCDNKYFQIKQGTIWDGTTLYKLYQQAFTPWDWQAKLQKVAKDVGLLFFSSPFDITAVELLASINVPAYKVASFEIQDIPLIESMAKQQKPMIISTGIASKEDIALALRTCKKVGNSQIALLKCTSAYPTPLDEVNLATLTDIKKRYKTVVGISDHTTGDLVAVSSIGLGAKIIEKHFILDRSMGGPDSSFSMEPDEFAQMVQRVRDAEKILGKATYTLSKSAKKNKEFGRSLFVVEDMKAGDIFSEKTVRSIRPGFGLHPKYYYSILGKKAAKSISRGTPLSWKHIL